MYLEYISLLFLCFISLYFYRMYLVFIFLTSQIHPYILQKKIILILSDS